MAQRTYDASGRGVTEGYKVNFPSTLIRYTEDEIETLHNLF